MKIHIVQKGDTLWDIAQTYGVDFEELKEVNSQISSPDMMMPGMKIKIPTSTKAVKKEQKKEVKKEEKSPKEQPVKEMPLMKEDEKEKKVETKPTMPIPQMPQPPQVPGYPMMPMPEMELEKNDTIQMPDAKKEKEKVPIKEGKKEEEHHPPEMHDSHHDQSKNEYQHLNDMMPESPHMPPHEPMFYACVPCIPIYPVCHCHSSCCGSMQNSMPMPMPVPTPMPEMHPQMMMQEPSFSHYPSEMPMYQSGCGGMGHPDHHQMHAQPSKEIHGVPNHVEYESMHQNKPMETYPPMISQTNFNPVPPNLRSNDEE